MKNRTGDKVSNVITTLELLVDGLKSKEQNLQDVLRYTKEQSSMLTPQSMDIKTFNNIIRNKQIRINQIQSVDDGFQQECERIQLTVEKNPELYRDYIEQMKAYIKSISDLGVEISVIEHRNNDAFKKVMANMKEDVRSFRTNKKAAVNYYSTYQKQQKTMHNGFFDSKK